MRGVNLNRPRGYILSVICSNITLYIPLRETDTIETHIQALVTLLRTCLSFDLQSTATLDSPHVKLVSDILSCVFQVSYGRGQRGLCRTSSIKTQSSEQ